MHNGMINRGRQAYVQRTSLIKIMNERGPRMVPCGNIPDSLPAKETSWHLSVKQYDITINWKDLFQHQSAKSALQPLGLIQLIKGLFWTSGVNSAFLEFSTAHRGSHYPWVHFSAWNWNCYGPIGPIRPWLFRAKTCTITLFSVKG